MKTNFSVLLLIVFSSSIFAQFAFTFRFPEGDPGGCDVPKSKDGHHFLSRGANSYHPGVDFNIGGTSYNEDEGEAIMSIASGEVMEAYFNPLKWGYIILIKHVLPAPDSGVILSFYAHLKSISVSAGDIVDGGDTIGTVGRGPNRMYSAHLHFEMRKGNMAGKPASFYPAGKSMAWVKAHYFDPRVFFQNPLLAIRDRSDTITSKRICHRQTRPVARNILLAKVQKIIPDTAAKFLLMESAIAKISFKAETTVADQTSVWKKNVKINSFDWCMHERIKYQLDIFVFNKAVYDFFAKRVIPSGLGLGCSFERYNFNPADRYAYIVRPASRYF
jgi:murein DD-endopeptidase MepM/ murein hydrolase activator NlpD